MIRAWVSHDQDTWLTESSLDLIGECTGRVAAGDGSGTGVGTKLEHGTLRRETIKQMLSYNTLITVKGRLSTGKFVKIYRSGIGQ